MRIAIDASPAAKSPRTGTEFYTLHLILALAEIDADNEYVLLFTGDTPQEFVALPGNFQSRRIPQRWLWAQTRLAWELRRLRPDVFFAPANVVPFVHPQRCVTTVHDVAFRLFPESYSPFVRWYLDLTTRFALRRAVKVIAVSRATKEDLEQIYGADPSRIEVIHSGVPALREEPPAPDEVASTLKRLGITPPYLLFLGRLETKKNVARIVQAFLKLKGQGLPHQLVLGGSPGLGFSEMKALIDASLFAEDIILTGYVGDEKDCLYAGADAFVFPSLYEGFGFPILEAFTHGTPVVTSGSSSLSEVAGDAAVLVDPLDVEQIAHGISQVLGAGKLREKLVEGGYERLRDFDWRTTAAAVLEVLQEVGSSRAGDLPT